MTTKNEEEQINKPIKLLITQERSKTLLAWICVAAIAVITYFVFSPSLDDGFTNWDDPGYVQNSPLVLNNTVPLMKIFETPVLGNYHPITMLSLALNYQTGKLNPFGYHLVNVIFHLLNTILVFFFIFLLTRRNLLIAAIVSLFFGIHPMHVESVTWVSERKDVLYVFFFLSGLITYLRYSDTKKIIWYFFTFLLFILSCLSKGMAVVFPAVLLLIDYFRGVKWDKRSLFEKIPFFLFALVVGIVAFDVQTYAIGGLKTYTLLQRLMFASYGAIMYMVKLFIPFRLAAFYPYPVTNSNGGISPVFYLSPLILLGVVAVLVYFFRKKEKEIVFGLLFYFVSVALVLQFISVGATIMADRYSYLSYIGLLFIVAYLINKAWLGLSQYGSGKLALMKYLITIIVIGGVIIFSYQSYSRVQTWKNSETLWTDVLDNYPNTSIAYISRAEYYYDNNKDEKAMSDYNTALQLPPSDPTSFKNAYYNRGILYFDFYKENDLALADFNKAIELDSAFSTAYNYRGILFSNTGKTNLAKNDFTKAIKFDSTDVSAYSNRAFIYFTAGKNDSALIDCNKAVAHDSLSALYHYNRGLCYNAINNYEKAADDFTRGITLNPPNVELYYNMRGQCDINLQKYNEAVADFSKAIALNPWVVGYWLNRSVAEGKAGQDEQAKADALKAQQLQGK